MVCGAVRSGHFFCGRNAFHLSFPYVFPPVLRDEQQGLRYWSVMKTLPKGYKFLVVLQNETPFRMTMWKFKKRASDEALFCYLLSKIYVKANVVIISATCEQMSAFRRNVASSSMPFSALGNRRPETVREASSVKSTCQSSSLADVWPPDATFGWTYLPQAPEPRRSGCSARPQRTFPQPARKRTD